MTTTMRNSFIRDDANELVRFRSYSVFARRNEWYKLVELRVLQDGRFEFEGELWILDRLRHEVGCGNVCTQIHNEKYLLIPDLIGFYVRDVIPVVDEAEFFKEIDDIQRELNGNPTTTDECRKAFQRFQEEPTETNRLKLKEAYEAVPKHLVCWLLSFDEKDTPIRKAIYGDKFREH